MAMLCSGCNYHTDDNVVRTCPRCGGGMQFTMLGPLGGQPDGSAQTEPPAWEVENPDDWESVELPIHWRTAQIWAGIGFYFAAGFVWRWILAALVIGMLVGGQEAGAVLLSVVILTMGVYVIVAILAGLIAGAGTINWLPQGLGVAGGLLVLPLISLLFLSPESLPVYLITVVLTTGFCVLGAFLGHILKPAARVQKSLANAA